MRKEAGLLILFCLFMPGCVVSNQEKAALDKKIENVNFRLDSMENKMDIAEQKLNILEGDYKELMVKKRNADALSSAKSALTTTQDIQIALKNAGFFNGPVDGKTGVNFGNAVKEFQKANGLKADGIVGAKTMALLVKYFTEEMY